MALRIEVPRPRMFGIAFTPRGVLVASALCVAGGVLGVLLDTRIVAVLCGFALMVVLLSGYLAWMSQITWRKNPRAFVVTDDTLLIEGPEPLEIRLSEITSCSTIDQGVFPVFLQIHHAGRNLQYTVSHVAPADVKTLVDAIGVHLQS